jgi:hypothetical protein
MTSVDIGSGVTSIVSCPKSIVVGLTGQTSSSWFTDAIEKETKLLKTDSDGY